MEKHEAIERLEVIHSAVGRALWHTTHGRYSAAVVEVEDATEALDELRSKLYGEIPPAT